MKRALLIPLLVLFLAAPAHAAVYTVTTGDDGNGSCPALRLPCTLRTALNNASQNGTTDLDTINLDPSIATYSVSTGQPLTVPPNVLIFGYGADINTIRETSGKSRTLAIAAGVKSRIVNVTIADGRAQSTSDGYGGNILVNYTANLELDHVRITGGIALHGGGIAARGGGRVDITHSLIDNNQAQAIPGAGGGDGGGIHTASLADTATPQTLNVSDTTVAFNTAATGAGIAATTNKSNTTTLERVTLANNTATTAPAGILNSLGGTLTVKSSIVARNSGGNCGTTKPTDGGGNVESGTDCGFALASDRQGTDAGLGAVLVMDGGMTAVLPIPSNSVARELAGVCTGTDQRDVNRPQGALCDAGAYEAIPPVPPAATPVPIATIAPVPTPTVTPAPTPTPTPTFRKTVVVSAAGGTVLVKQPGSKQFVPLSVAQAIKLGSSVDVRKGKVKLTSVPKAGGTPETATFYDGIFKVTQVGGITNLTLVEALAACPKRGHAAAAAKKPKTRKLWGDGKGAFRTSGKYSAATVRGTKWLVQDSCAGTLTRVAHGLVSVRDNVKKRTLLVKAPHRYLAKPKR